MSLSVKNASHRQGPKSGTVRRKERRVNVRGIVGDIADGSFVFAGIVEDVSSAGMKMSHLPMNFSRDKSSYRTIISGDGKHYRLLVRPCWVKEDRANKTIAAGFKIIDASWEWEEFILEASSDASTMTRGYHA